MPSPKFQAGQMVKVVQSKRFAKAGGGFQVGCLLPTLNGVNQYLIESTVDGHQRVVTEHEIV